MLVGADSDGWKRAEIRMKNKKSLPAKSNPKPKHKSKLKLILF